MDDYDKNEKKNSLSIEKEMNERTIKALSECKIFDEKYWVSSWLIRHGDSFEIGLGMALVHADGGSLLKIRREWPKIWMRALAFSEKRRENNDYY